MLCTYLRPLEQIRKLLKGTNNCQFAWQRVNCPGKENELDIKVILIYIYFLITGRIYRNKETSFPRVLTQNIQAMEYFAGQITVSEQIRILKRHSNLTSKLVKATHFNSRQVEYLILLYYQILRDGNGLFMTDSQLEEIFNKSLNMTDQNILKLIFVVIKKKATTEILIEQWVGILSLFLFGTLEEHIAFCYSIYDSLGTGKISKETAFLFLRNSIYSNVISGGHDEDSVRDLIDIIMQKLDADRDGKISFEDYRSSVIKNPAFMQFLGPCLPERQDVQKFINTCIVDPNIFYY